MASVTAVVTAVRAWINLLCFQNGPATIVKKPQRMAVMSGRHIGTPGGVNLVISIRL